MLIGFDRAPVEHPMAEINEALVNAQAECKNATHNRFNSHFKSSYADLAAVKECVVPIFLRHGLSILQGTNVTAELGFHLETRIRHTSGQEVIFRFPLPPDTMQIQKVGSVITYARRYTYAMIGAIVAEDDLDGNETIATKSAGRPADDGKGDGGGHFL